MTTFDRDPLFDPRISDWLEADPDRAPGIVLETVVAALPSIPQRRASRVPRRFPAMSMPARLAVAAVIGVLLLGGTFFAFNRPGQPAVGGPGPSPSVLSSPTPAATATPTPSPSAALVAAPLTTLGDWEAEADTAVPGLIDANERIQLSIDWQDGLHTWIQKADGTSIMKAESVSAPDGEIRLVATAAGFPDCNGGDVGRYAWQRSADGMYLTLTSIQDACAVRATAMARTWVHSLGAVNDGGPGVVPGFADRWIQATLPHQRFGMSGGTTEAADISTMDGGTISFVAIKDPLGFATPCAASPTPTSIGTTPAKVVSYIRGLPGLDVKTATASVGGHPATRVSVTSNTSSTCPSGQIAAFHTLNAADDATWTVTPGESHVFWVVEVDGDTFVLFYEGQTVTPSDLQATISSVRFLNRLPTPTP